MFRTLTFIGLVFGMQPNTFAETAATSVPLPMDQLATALKQELESVPVTTSVRALLIKAHDPASQSDRDVIATYEKLRDDSIEMTVKDLLPLMTPERPLVAALFSSHEKAVVRFFANVVVLAGSGNATAAKELHSLIHSKTPSAHEKRIIKAYCIGVGIRPESDTAEDILAHVSAMTSNEPLLKAGDEAPDFSLTTVDGKQYTRDALRGKMVVLHFWATWCNPCMGRLPGHHRMLYEHAADDCVVIFVNLDVDHKSFEDAVATHQLTLGNVYRGNGWGDDLARTFGVNTLPYDVVIDETGRIIHAQNDGLAEVLEKRN